MKFAYATQLDNPADDKQSFAFIFEVRKWTGTILTDDPDGKVREAQFLTLEDALAKLQLMPWEHMRDPIVAYLKNDTPAGTMWLYRQESPNRRRMIQRL